MTLLSTCLQKKGAEEFCMKEKVQSTKLIYDLQVQLDQTVNCTDKIKYSIIYLQDSFFFNLIYKYYLLKSIQVTYFYFMSDPLLYHFLIHPNYIIIIIIIITDIFSAWANKDIVNKDQCREIRAVFCVY